MNLLRGRITDVSVRKPDGWCVFGVIDVSQKFWRVTGVFPDNVDVNDTIEVAGAVATHPRFGEQFKATHLVVYLPGADTAIEQWLEANLPQIGPERAAALVKYFGSGLWSVLEAQPQELLKIPGINEARADAIVEVYATVKVQREIIIKLVGAGLTVNKASEIVSIYKAETMTNLETEPYNILLRQRVSFEQADRVARRLFNLPKEDPRRIRAYAEQVLRNETYLEGHCYTLWFHLLRETGNFLKLKDDVVGEALDGANTFVRFDKRVYLLDLNEAEVAVSEAIRVRLSWGGA